MDSKISVIDNRVIKPVVYIIDSDQKLQLSLSRQLNLHDVAVELFESAEDFLKIKLRSRPACLVIDVNLPDMDGIALLEHINNLGHRLPAIVLCSGNDVSIAVRAMQAKAVDFIEKPFIEDTLIKIVLNLIN
jgi:FixJ family two-component response regulator